MVPGGPAALQAGDQLPSLIDTPVSVTDIVRYQGASGDMNPIHHDPGIARTVGFPGVFSVGMLHAGILGSYVADLFGPEHVRRFGAQFREQVWPGDVLTYSGTVARRRVGPAGSAIELDLHLTARRHRGGEHLRASAAVTVPL
jgi:acyl dehydratase